MNPFDWVSSTPRLEPVDYFKKPRVILRFICLVFAIVVLCVVHNSCYIYDICLFNASESTCRFTVFLCFTTTVLCAVFALLDLWVDNIPNCSTRKRIVVADLGSFGFWTFLWFVTFCTLCNRWQYTSDELLDKNQVNATGPRVAITFTFFVLVALGILTYLCYTAYKAVNLLLSNLDNMDAQPPGFGGYANAGSNNYQGFTQDADMLDPSGPARLGSESPPLRETEFGYSSNKKQSGGVFTGTPVDAYQP
ncbi:unnamed protein product [Calicophoron daubneyi]|uniref:MARVEL domain-containing protein n=1 Tax=Calicophoron daubneyi TaxID=300641 RepID=A0AAV2TS16_CALDB